MPNIKLGDHFWLLKPENIELQLFFLLKAEVWSWYPDHSFSVQVFFDNTKVLLMLKFPHVTLNWLQTVCWFAGWK